MLPILYPPILFARRVVHDTKWRFLAVEDALLPSAVKPEQRAERQRKYVSKLLDVAASAAFKVWQLSPMLMAVQWLLAAAAAGAAVWLFYTRRQDAILPASLAGVTFGGVGTWVVVAIATAILAAVVNRVFGHRYGGGIMKAIQWRDTLQSVALGASMAAGGFVLARLHLHVFDRWYLRYGRLDRL